MKIDYNAMTENEQIAAVSQDGFVIEHIKTPSEAVCMAAVSKFGIAVKYIQNPSEAVCMAAALENSYAIQHIQNPSEAVQMAMVSKNGLAVRHIKTPSEPVQLAAVKRNGHAIQNIKNPSEAVCLVVVQQDGYAIRYIEDPSDAVQITAIKSSPDIFIYYIPEHPSQIVMAAQIIHHPLYPRTPKSILDRAPEILESHCVGLGDVYTIGLSMAMTGEDLSRTMLEWIESHQNMAAGAEMAP